MATGPLFAFPHGGDLRLAWLTPVIFGCFALGTMILFRQRRRVAAVLVLPILLTLAAAALRRYPFGLSARVNLYLVPAVLILAAAGMSWIWSKIPRVVVRRRIVIACGCLLALFAVGRLGSDLGHPYRAPWDRTGREFARWFWEEMSASGEVVCVRSDLGISFGPKRWCYDGADQYLCYQRIYSRRHREGGFRGGTACRRRIRYGACCSRGGPRMCGALRRGSRSIEIFTRSSLCRATRRRGAPLSSPRSCTSCASSCRMRVRWRRANE